LEDYIGTISITDSDIVGTVIGMLLAAVLAFILAEVYKRFGSSISNREKFGNNFLPIAMTTTLIISVVKSSLALSLGLVGALSVIRFRTAIKEPEELVYLFLCIAIGLGIGASLYSLTTTAFIIIVACLVFVSIGKPNNELGMNFIVKSQGVIDAKSVSDILKSKGCRFTLRRSDTNEKGTEVAYFIDSITPDRLLEVTREIKNADGNAKISYYEAQVGI
jgi:phosphotransferase system  glucose/maltose/N-acetylglucosamine-specific IIC component